MPWPKIGAPAAKPNLFFPVETCCPRASNNLKIVVPVRLTIWQQHARNFRESIALLHRCNILAAAVQPHFTSVMLTSELIPGLYVHRLLFWSTQLRSSGRLFPAVVLHTRPGTTGDEVHLRMLATDSTPRRTKMFASIWEIWGLFNPWLADLIVMHASSHQSKQRYLHAWRRSVGKPNKV